MIQEILDFLLGGHQGEKPARGMEDVSTVTPLN